MAALLIFAVDNQNLGSTGLQPDLESWIAHKLSSFALLGRLERVTRLQRKAMIRLEYGWVNAQDAEELDAINELDRRESDR